MSEKYSAGPNSKATAASGGAKKAISKVAIQPATKDPIAAVANALPAWPLRAIWYPSRVVTIEEASPGRFIRIAVVEPPY